MSSNGLGKMARFLKFGVTSKCVFLPISVSYMSMMDLSRVLGRASRRGRGTGGWGGSAPSCDFWRFLAAELVFLKWPFSALSID